MQFYSVCMQSFKMLPAVDCFPWVGDSRRTLYKSMQTVIPNSDAEVKAPPLWNFMVLSSALHKGKRIKEKKNAFSWGLLKLALTDKFPAECHCLICHYYMSKKFEKKISPLHLIDLLAWVRCAGFAHKYGTRCNIKAWEGSNCNNNLYFFLAVT